MSQKELARKSVFEWVRLGQGSLVEAATQLRLSYRQTNVKTLQECPRTRPKLRAIRLLC